MPSVAGSLSVPGTKLVGAFSALVGSEVLRAVARRGLHVKAGGAEAGQKGTGKNRHKPPVCAPFTKAESFVRRFQGRQNSSS